VSGRGALECEDCGFQFPVIVRKVKHSRTATIANAMSDEPLITNVAQWFNVKSIHYEIHTKPNSANSLKCLYRTDAQWVLSWIAFASDKPYARQKAAEWWKARGGLDPVPPTAEDALKRIDELARIRTRRIKVKKEGKYFNILQHELVQAESNKITSGNLGASDAA
jgi:DNA repair protein RadD